MPELFKRGAGGLALSAAMALTAVAQDTTGVTDTTVKIGNISPYSGPASAYSTIAKTIDAYFTKVNEQGGINGRTIEFISYDDGYSPPKAVEQARKLVESDEVLLIFQPLGTPSNAAIRQYMNMKKVPQLFVPPARPCSATPRNTLGRWAGSPTTCRRA
jgi:branched-chain amino acid transport system substrate-binding protein